MIEDEENSKLDDSLRRLFEDYQLPPAEPVWTGIEQRIRQQPPPKRRRPLPLPLLLTLVGLLGVVGGWLLPHPQQALVPATTTASRTHTPLADAAQAKLRHPQQAALTSAPAPTAHPKAATPADRLVLVPPTTVTQPGAAALLSVRGTGLLPAASPALHPGEPIPAATLAAGTDSLRSAPLVPAVLTPTIVYLPASDSVPGLVRPLAALTRQTLGQLRDSATLQEPSRRVALVASLRAERGELLRLQRRVDSLLLTLGAVPLANQVPLASASAAPVATDTIKLHTPLRRWSLLLTTTPEQNHQQLQTTGTDTLQLLRRNQERGRRGINVAALAEYRLNNRVSIGAGLGYTRAGSELRVAERRTDVSVRYDTTTTTAVNVYSSTHTTYSIRLEQIPQLNPVFNQSGQVIRYDTVYITRPDTVFTTIVQHDTVRTTNHTVTPLLDKRTTTTYKNLAPTYHFFTVPVLLRYRLTLAENTRWWADVAAGAQIQLFLGGSQLVTEDGHTFRTERVRMTEGPYRPLNLALSGSIGVNYALTPRLSLSLAPSLRWQALSVYKPSTGLIQRNAATGLQIGARWQL